MLTWGTLLIATKATNKPLSMFSYILKKIPLIYHRKLEPT